MARDRVYPNRILVKTATLQNGHTQNSHKTLATKTATTKTATLYRSKRPHREDHYQNGQTAFGQNGHKGRITTKTATLHLVKTAAQGGPLPKWPHCIWLKRPHRDRGRITGPDHQQNRHTCQTAATRVTTKTATLSSPCQAAVMHAGVLARMQQGPFL